MEPTPADPARDPYLSVVVPVCNEVESLDELVAELGRTLAEVPGECEAIIVDDGSRDGSWERLVVLASERPWLKALRFLGRQGQTAAMAAGIEAARGELVAFLDGDLQNDPRDILTLLAPIRAGHADVACGWRRHRRDSLARTVVSALANRLINWMLGLRLHDVGCTLKVFRREFLEAFDLLGEMHRFLAAYALAAGARIVELEVGHRPRRHGRSHYGFNRIYKVVIDLFTVKLLTAYGAKPAYFFAMVALGFLALAVFAGAALAYSALVLARPPSLVLALVVVGTLLAAVTSFLSGLIAEVAVRAQPRAGARRPYRVVARLGGAADESHADPSRRQETNG